MKNTAIMSKIADLQDKRIIYVAVREAILMGFSMLKLRNSFLYGVATTILLSRYSNYKESAKSNSGTMN